MDVKFSAFFSDQKRVHGFPRKAFDFGYVILKPCVTHFNATTDSKSDFIAKGLMKRVEKLFRQLLTPCCQKNMI